MPHLHPRAMNCMNRLMTPQVICILAYLWRNTSPENYQHVIDQLVYMAKGSNDNEQI